MNFDQVLELVKTVSDSDLTSFQYEEGNQRITMQTGGLLFGAADMSNTSVVANAGINTNGGINANAAMDSNAAMNTNVTMDINTAMNAEATASTKTAAKGELVTAPLVGRFYTAPSEDAEDYVKVGDTVKKGQILAIVEAMKLMNEIESDYDGVVTEILAESGEGVEYGQPLFRIEQ